MEELLKHAWDRGEEMFLYSRKETRKGLYLDQLLSTTNLVEENIGNYPETVSSNKILWLDISSVFRRPNLLY